MRKTPNKKLVLSRETLKGLDSVVGAFQVPTASGDPTCDTKGRTCNTWNCSANCTGNSCACGSAAYTCDALCLTAQGCQA